MIGGRQAVRAFCRLAVKVCRHPGLACVAVTLHMCWCVRQRERV